MPISFAAPVAAFTARIGCCVAYHAIIGAEGSPQGRPHKAAHTSRTFARVTLARELSIPQIGWTSALWPLVADVRSSRREVVRTLHRVIDDFLGRYLCRLDGGSLCRVGRDSGPYSEGRQGFRGSDGEWAISGHTGESDEVTEFLFETAFARAPRQVCELGFNVGHSAVTMLVAAGANASYVGFDKSVLNPGLNEEFFEMLRAWLGGSGRRFDMRWGDASEELPRYIMDRSANGTKFRSTGCELTLYDGPHDVISVLRLLPMLRHLAAPARPIVVIDDVRCSRPICTQSSLAWDFLVWSGQIREIGCRSARSSNAVHVGADFGICVGEFLRGPRAVECASFDPFCVAHVAATAGASSLDGLGGGAYADWQQCCIDRNA